MVSRIHPPSDDSYVNLAACVISLALIELSDVELISWADSPEGRSWAEQARLPHWQLTQEVKAMVEVGRRPVIDDDEDVS